MRRAKGRAMGWKLLAASLLLAMGLLGGGCITLGLKAADAIGGAAARSDVAPVRGAGKSTRAGVAKVEQAEAAAVRRIVGN